jgi:hypothetical protein
MGLEHRTAMNIKIALPIYKPRTPTAIYRLYLEAHFTYNWGHHLNLNAVITQGRKGRQRGNKKRGRYHNTFFLRFLRNKWHFWAPHAVKRPNKTLKNQ